MNVAYWVKLKKRSTLLFFKSNSHRFIVRGVNQFQTEEMNTQWITAKPWYNLKLIS